MNIELVKSNKGFIKLIVDGYCYHLDKKYKTNFYWECECRKTYMCKSRVISYEENGKHLIKKGPNTHSHTPVAANPSVYKANAELKELAKQSHLPPANIIATVTSQCAPNCRVYLPPKEAQKSKIGRVRRANDCSEPLTLQEIAIPENLKYVDGDLFLLSEKEFDNEKIIVLGTLENLKELGKCDLWLMDGTFQVVPSIMRQLFTIHGKIGDEIVPLIYIIMSSKSKKAYCECFFVICEIAVANNISMNPKYIISDFEKASIAAAKELFPSSLSKACFFHFGQIIWRRIQKEKLASKYGNNEGIRFLF